MNNRESTSEPSVWADLAFLALPMGLFGIALFVGLKLGLIAPLGGPNVAVLAAALLSVCFTNMFGFYAAKRAVVHRVGFQLCSLTLGTSLSLLAIQLLSSADILPSLAGSTLANAFNFIPGGIVAQRAAMISFLGLVSILGLGITARIVRAIDHESPKWPAALKLLTYAIGFTMLFGYVLLMMGRL